MPSLSAGDPLDGSIKHGHAEEVQDAAGEGAQRPVPEPPPVAVRVDADPEEQNNKKLFIPTY